MAHKWCEEHIQGKNPKMPINQEVQSAVNAFLDWEKKHKVKFISTELKIYSKKYKYAGTMDFEAEIDGKLPVSC